MRRIGRARRRPRLRRIVGGAAAAVAILGGWFFTRTPEWFDFRVWWARHINGYDGCLCDQCALMYIGMEHPWDAVNLPLLGWADAGEAAELTWAYSLFLALLAILVNRVRLHRDGSEWECGGCGYDLRGIGDRPCPECGSTTRERTRGTLESLLGPPEVPPLHGEE